MIGWAQRGGISRAVAILLILIAVMLVVISVPAWKAYKRQADEFGCMASLKTASDSLAIEVIMEGDALTVNTSKETLARTMPGRTQLCPSGGNVYFIPQENGTYKLVCGLHSSEEKLRTRLNASYAADLLADEYKRQKTTYNNEPDVVTIQLNGSPLDCVRTDKAVPIHRGTGTTDGYDGVVAFYAIEGDKGWIDTGAEEGALCYFLYADELHYAVWTPAKGWDGDCMN